MEHAEDVPLPRQQCDGVINRVDLFPEKPAARGLVTDRVRRTNPNCDVSRRLRKNWVFAQVPNSQPNLRASRKLNQGLYYCDMRS